MVVSGGEWRGGGEEEVVVRGVRVECLLTRMGDGVDGNMEVAKSTFSDGCVHIHAIKSAAQGCDRKTALKRPTSRVDHLHYRLSVIVELPARLAWGCDTGGGVRATAAVVVGGGMLPKISHSVWCS